MTTGEIRNIGKLHLEKTRWLDFWQNFINIYSIFHFIVVAIPFFLCPFYVFQHFQIRLWIPPDLAVRLHQRPTKRNNKWKVVLELHCKYLQQNYTYLHHQGPDFLLWKFSWQLPEFPSRDIAAVILVQGGECQLRPRHHLSLQKMGNVHLKSLDNQHFLDLTSFTTLFFVWETEIDNFLLWCMHLKLLRQGI